MADDNHENGTSNGDVPEIELIIKVSVPRAIENRRASETNRYIGRERKTEEKGEAVVPCVYGRGASNWCPFAPAGNRGLGSPPCLSRRDAATVKIDRSAAAAVGQRGNNPRRDR